MAFWGRSFVFNDIPCEDYDLMMYDIGNVAQSAGKFASGVTIIEDQLSTKWRPYFYGATLSNKLQFSIVFGVNQRRIDMDKPLDRYELDAIACWLTGHKKYLWLEIEQEDLAYVRYKCIINGLEMVEFGDVPWALKATIVCDSPYAYMYPQTFRYTVNGTQTINFYNESSHNGYFMPQLDIKLTGNKNPSLSITNLSDNNRELKLDGIPASISSIHIDNDAGIITCPEGINLYPYFNFNFLRLVNGVNSLQVSGNVILEITCEFPINVGG